MPKVNRSSFLVVGFVILASGTSASIAACSSDSTTTPDPGDAAPETGPKIDSGSSTSSSGSSGETDGGTTDCVTKCFQDHPEGEKKYDAIDVCWEAKCKGPCVDENGMFDAGADAALCNDNGKTPLKIAADGRHPGVIELLQRANGVLSRQSWTDEGDD